MNHVTQLLDAVNRGEATADVRRAVGRRSGLTLSADGQKLEGSWTNTSGESGIWTLLRAADGAKPEAEQPRNGPGWVPLFNGKHLTGWKPGDKANTWQVRHGVLAGAGQGATLTSALRHAGDLRLRADGRGSRCSGKSRPKRKWLLLRRFRCSPYNGQAPVTAPAGTEGPCMDAPAVAPPLFPLPSPEGSQPWLTPRQLDRWVLAFVVLGLVARCVRYFLRFPLWEDESFLCVNFIDRTYADLLNPLRFHQTAPLLFLWLQLTVTKLLGFHELTLRLLPFLASIGSIVLFWRLALRCLDGVPRLLAMAVFSVTYATIRYSAEAKPYGIDLLLALLMVYCTVRWLQEPGRPRWLWGLALLIAPAVGLSYGCVLLGGGLALAIGWAIVQHRRWESVGPWLVYGVLLVGSFAGFYFLCIHGQEAHDLEVMREGWHEHFPPTGSLLEFAYWMLHTHTGDIVAYPAGGSPHQSSLSALCWFAALVALARRRHGTMLVLGLAPLAVTFVAALLQRFPYGGHIRMNLYMAPWMCLLIGYGLTVLLAFAVRRGARPERWLKTALAVLAIVGGATVIRDLSGPYKNISDERARAFAEWFWYNAAHDGEVACVTHDLGRDFAPGCADELSFVAEYLCNQRMYSPRLATGAPIHWEQLSATHPLRCVLYRVDKFAFDEPAFQRWLHEMQTAFVLEGRESYPQVRLKNTGRIIEVDHIEIFRFVPRPGLTPARLAQVACAREMPAAAQERTRLSLRSSR